MEHFGTFLWMAVDEYSRRRTKGRGDREGGAKVQKKEPDDFYFAMKETADYQENRVRGINGRERQIKRRMKGR